MNKLFVSLLALCLITGTAAAQIQLTTTFAGGNGQSGCMFDITATGGQAVEICGFDFSAWAAGTYDMEVYTVSAGGPFLGNQTNPAAWTLQGQSLGIPVAAANTAIPLGMPLSVTIPAGATQGFYVTCSNGQIVAYTNGTVQGAAYASDGNITFYEGIGLAYPYGGSFTPRIFNGNIYYATGTGGCAAPPAAPWQTNSASSSLDIDGINGSAFQGPKSVVCFGGTSTLNTAVPSGTPSDIAVVFGAHAPTQALSSPNNVVNIDVFNPTMFSFNGGAPNFAGLLNLTPHPGAYSFPIPTGSTFVASAQQLAIDGTNPDGYALSQAPEITVTVGGVLTYAHADDGFVQTTLNVSPICGTSVDFYGTSYTDVFSNSNGWASFVSGSTAFIASQAEWQTLEPRIGMQGDLEPNNFGTVTLTNNGPALSGSPGSSHLTMSYANVTEWGTGGLGVTSYDIVLNGPNGHEIANFTTDGSWGITPVAAGMTLGAGGTHPPLVSFDALFGTGLQANVLGTDSVVDFNAGGMLANVNGWSNIQFPLLDGSAYIVQ
ncbi:MAG: hypothetical protein VX913_13120 [Planctomycetota bacterium]|nr:hypothetical protein [Planctomycetota bacterium]